MKSGKTALVLAVLLISPALCLAVGAGSLTPGSWEEAHLRLLVNAFGLPFPDNIRPITGSSAGQILVEIEAREDFETMMKDRYLRSVHNRLRRRFAYECALVEKKDTHFKYALRPLDGAALNTGLRDRAGSSDTLNFETAEHPSAIFGDLQFNHGLALDGIFAVDVSESAAGQWMPQNDNESSDGSVLLERLSTSTIFLDTQLVIGRQELVWGYAKLGDLLLSGNAGHLDAINLQAHRPFELPWYLAYLGQWQPQVFVARIDGNRADFDHPYLAGMKLFFSPTPWPWLEGSIGRTIMTLGEGRPAMDAGDWWNVLIGKNEHTYGGSSDTNGLFETDVRLHFGFLRRWLNIGSFAAYFQYGAESFSRDLRVAYVNGKVLGVEYEAARFGLWLEGAETLTDEVAWYTHYVYTDGYTQRGKIIGRPMGAFARQAGLGGRFFATESLELKGRIVYTDHAGKRWLEKDERLFAKAEFFWFLNRGFYLTGEAGGAKTNIPDQKESTMDILGRVGLGWNFNPN